MILSVDRVELDFVVVFALGPEVLCDDLDSLEALSLLLLWTCDLISLMDFASKGRGCCSCLIAADGINRAPDTLRLVCTEATIIHPSVDVVGVSVVRYVVVFLVRSVVDSVVVCFEVRFSSTVGATGGNTFFFTGAWLTGTDAIVAPSSTSLISLVAGASVLSIDALSTKPMHTNVKNHNYQTVLWNQIRSRILKK